MSSTLQKPVGNGDYVHLLYTVCGRAIVPLFCQAIRI